MELLVEDVAEVNVAAVSLAVMEVCQNSSNVLIAMATSFQRISLVVLTTKLMPYQHSVIVKPAQ